MGRWYCEECRTVHAADKLLTAPNPFDGSDIIHGCPQCKSIDHFALLCDVPKCQQITTCGWPSPDGYRQTCYTHWNKDQEEAGS